MTGKNSLVLNKNPPKNQKWTDDLAQCVREQSECKSYLDGPGLDKDGVARSVRLAHGRVLDPSGNNGG